MNNRTHTHLVLLVRRKLMADVFPTSADSMITLLSICASVAMRSMGHFQIVPETQWTTRNPELLDGDTNYCQSRLHCVRCFSKMSSLNKQKNGLVNANWPYNIRWLKILFFNSSTPKFIQVKILLSSHLSTPHQRMNIQIMEEPISSTTPHYHFLMEMSLALWGPDASSLGLIIGPHRWRWEQINPLLTQQDAARRDDSSQMRNPDVCVDDHKHWHEGSSVNDFGEKWNDVFPLWHRNQFLVNVFTFSFHFPHVILLPFTALWPPTVKCSIISCNKEMCSKKNTSDKCQDNYFWSTDIHILETDKDSDQCWTVFDSETHSIKKQRPRKRLEDFSRPNIESSTHVLVPGESQAEGKGSTAEIHDVDEASVYLHWVCQQQTDAFVHLPACALTVQGVCTCYCFFLTYNYHTCTHIWDAVATVCLCFLTLKVIWDSLRFIIVLCIFLAASCVVVCLL